jgi:DNA-3-methyladenine glycosylase I
MLVLESFQSGLSWITILRRREGFTKAFQEFDPNLIANWGDVEVADLVQNSVIIRHRGKIEVTLGNARAWQRLQAGARFSDRLRVAVDGRPVQNNWRNLSDVPAQTKISLKLSPDLKAAGFRFCGPKIVYALTQAAGLVNDHLII